MDNPTQKGIFWINIRGAVTRSRHVLHREVNQQEVKALK